MGLLAQSNDLNHRLFSFAVSAALLSIAGLTAARWSRTGPRWGPARCAARRVRIALLIATCLGYAAFGLLGGLGYFSANPQYGHHELALSNLNGLLLILTVLSAVVELIVAKTEHPEIGAAAVTPGSPLASVMFRPVPSAGTE